MIKKSVKKRKTLVIDDVLCNKCGDSLVKEKNKVQNKARLDNGEEYISTAGLVHGKVCGNYHSTHLKDGAVYNFSLCEKCLKKMFDSFKIKVDEKEEGFFGDF